ncbi:MAG: hypothetical protein PHW24_01895 [Candidatus Moranbacteria bacterium]|nr:hypothetical protein [Candidatus Moranbacteria bacterium]
MKNISNSKIIITAFSFFVLISFVFLSLVEKKQADINTKNVWMTYFKNPKDASLDFAIENHSKNNNFHWQILSDKTLVNQGDVTVKLGETKTLPVSLSDTQNKKITISVTSSDNNKKEIYKIINN